VAIAERAFSEGYIKPSPPEKRTGKTVAVIGSGPAGLAAADLLNKAGHTVTLFEKDEKPGGLLRFGIPDFKLPKSAIDRRVKMMESEGLIVRTGVNIGKDIAVKEIIGQYDAVCLAIGSGQPRDLTAEGRDLNGIHFAMDFLSDQNRVYAGIHKNADDQITAGNKRVLVIGGGDTGSDCVGTAIRQKAASVTQIEILPMPPLVRTSDNPWPYFARILKTSTSQEEGCERLWSISTIRFTGKNNQVTGAEVEEVVWEKSGGKNVAKLVPGTRRILEADLVLLALGFVHPVTEGLISESGIELDARKNIKVSNSQSTSIKKVFAAGDSVSGASLVVNAIASGRKAAKEISRFLSIES
jgi:glutamate synthase (NADPH/NADH) small chain